METIYCSKHPDVAKVAMRNKRNAPMLGCPTCHGKAPEKNQEPTPTPAPEVKSVTRWGTILHQARQ